MPVWIAAPPRVVPAKRLTAPLVTKVSTCVSVSVVSVFASAAQAQAVPFQAAIWPLVQLRPPRVSASVPVWIAAPFRVVPAKRLIAPLVTKVST